MYVAYGNKTSNDTETTNDLGNEHEETTVQICTSKDFAYGPAINRLTAVQLPSLIPEQFSVTKPSSSSHGYRSAGGSSDGDQDEDTPNQIFPGVEEDLDERARRQILSSLGCFTSLDAVLAVGSGRSTSFRFTDMSCPQMGAVGALLSLLETVNAENDLHGPIAFTVVEALSR